MKRLDFKAKFLGLAMISLAVSAGPLVACSSDSQTQAQAPHTHNSGQSMDHGSMGGMNHGGMDHSMMDLGPADAEFDLRFIDSMIPHHEGAVVMAKEVLQKSKRPELKKLAQEVIKAQDKEIKQMKQWRTTWYPQAPSTPLAWHAQMGHSMAMTEEQIKAMRMDMDLGAADSEFDKRFIDAMIPHHEGAVVMAKDAVLKSKRPEILQLAKNIVTSQEAEISQMQQWRKAWYGK